MKACLLLQRRFAFVGHYLTVVLKEKYGINDFCALVNHRPSFDFLVKQRDTQYSKLLLFEDLIKKYKEEKLDINYLHSLEQVYGLPNLWPYLTVDRIIMSNQLVREYPYDKSPYTHEEMLKILQITFKSIISFLEKERPDFVLISCVAGIASMALYHIAQKMGIKTILIQPNYIKNKYVLSENYDSLSWVDKLLAIKSDLINAHLNAAKEFLDNFRMMPKPYDDNATPQNQPVSRVQQLNFLRPRYFLRNLIWLSKYIYYHFSRFDIYDYDYIGPWNYLKDGFKRKMRNLIGLNNLYDEFNPSENFAFFPLQFEPEISLLLWAPFFTDQINVIKQIAKSLPVDYKLYVKEHPAMVPYRPRRYYKELKKIPNLKLINPNISSYQIIPRAKLIVTITGTVGWEATLLKKPVITIGDVFYNRLSFVKNCRQIEKLPWFVKEQLENFKYDEKELLELIAAIFAESANLDLQYLWEKEEDETKQKKALEPLADLIAKKLNLQKNA